MKLNIYMDYRNKNEFSVTKDQLFYMGKMVDRLKEVTERESLKKIEALGE